MDLKEQHDEMLANKPDDAQHDAEKCIFCNPDNQEGGEMSSTNYTEDEVKGLIAKAVAEALAPFQEEAAMELLAKAIEDAKAPLVAEMQELQNKLDAAVLRAEKAEKDLDDLKTEIANEKAAAEEAALKEARREARKEAVKEFAFSEEWIAERLDRWVAMSDEDFSELLETLKVASAKKEEKKVTTTELPKATALKATSEDGGDKHSTRREVSRLGLRGVDIRTLG